MKKLKLKTLVYSRKYHETILDTLEYYDPKEVDQRIEELEQDLGIQNDAVEVLAESLNNQTDKLVNVRAENATLKRGAKSLHKQLTNSIMAHTTAKGKIKRIERGRVSDDLLGYICTVFMLTHSPMLDEIEALLAERKEQTDD